MGRRAKMMIGIMILVVLAVVIGYEMYEQTSENGWNRGTYSYNPNTK